jgi:hypothetical protein
MSEQVTCLSCKHRKLHSFLDHFASAERQRYIGYCEKVFMPAHEKFDPVIGNIKVEAKYETCGMARLDKLNKQTELCGPEGRWWEPKDKKDLFKFIKHVSV